MKIKAVLGIVFILLLPLGQAQAIVLNNWNDVDLNASGDHIDIEIGKIDGDTFFAMKWGAGADNLLSAIGIDQVYYNCEGCSFTVHKDDDAGSFGGVKAVWEGAIGTGDDVTADWQTNKGDLTAGGGFGTFNSRKNADGGTRAGIDDWLIFVLNGMVDFTGPPTFAAHVRYEDCSGWVSDGTTTEEKTGECGASIPEPATAWLIGLGLGLIGFARRKA